MNTDRDVLNIYTPQTNDKNNANDCWDHIGINFKEVYMHKTKLYIVVAGIILCMLYCSCSSQELSTQNTAANEIDACETIISENIKYRVDSQGSVPRNLSIDEFIDLADYIVLCTVEEIGNTFLYGNPTLDPEDITSISDYVRSIRTPVTLHIHKAFLDKIGIEDDTLTILLYDGIYGEYMLTHQYPNYELGHTYLLFIGQAPDGETNIVIPHGSVEIDLPEAMPPDAEDSDIVALATDAGTSFTHMFYGSSFDDMDSAAELFAAVEAAVAKLE